jgi:EmrB/QacA subfamily drug resistance transporter
VTATPGEVRAPAHHHPARTPGTATGNTPTGSTPTGSTAEPQEQFLLSHRQILVVLFGVMAGMFLAALDMGIINTALPRIVSELGGLDRLSWVVTAYLLTATAVTPLWGKLSDLYGRRLIFQIAIGIFLVGSVLSGASQDIGQLIAFRALQGVGGGGLFAIALAIIGDVIPPRERGRYQGYFGAVFGTSSVAGPLLGGFFTDGPGWRWVFYINVPIGLAALLVTSVALRRMPVVRRKRQIDYLGAAAVMAAVTCLLLYLDWRGRDYGWTEDVALVLLGGSILLTVAFVLVERRAAEPILPLRLFRNAVYSVGNAYNFLMGVAMFGTMVFLPVYLQAVKGLSPTASGMAMLPTIVGLLGTSTAAGHLMTRTGRYKVFPILGAAVVAVSMLLLSTLGVDTPQWQVLAYAFVFGFGLGLTMQTTLTAIQNAVEHRDMGVATSSATFFRQMGGAIGAAVFGAVLASRLSHYLAEQLSGAGVGQLPGGAAVEANDVQAIQELAEPVRGLVLSAFSSAVGDVFMVGAPFIVAAFVVALFLREVPLRTGAPAGGGGGRPRLWAIAQRRRTPDRRHPTERPSRPRRGTVRELTAPGGGPTSGRALIHHLPRAVRVRG